MFVEQEDQVYYMDVRLFIEGAEVSWWLQDTIGISLGGTGTNNSLSVTLANPDGLWLFTEDNAQKKWLTGKGPYDESAKKTIYENKQRRNSQDKVTKQWVYPLAPWQPVFHKHDCVRCFIRNPASYEDYWMPAFTGFIDTHPTQDDYLTGAANVSLSCYDIKGIMKKMRVSLNPMPSASDAGQIKGDFLAKDALLNEDAGMFQDLFGNGAKNHPLAGKSFEQALSFLFFGSSSYKTQGDSSISIDIFGGTHTATMSTEKDAAERKERTLTNEEKDALRKFEALNNKVEVIKRGSFDPNTGTWVSEKTYQDYNSSHPPSKREKQALASDARTALALSKALNAAKQRAISDKVKNSEKKSDGKTVNKKPTTVSTNKAYTKGHVGRFTKGYTFHYPGDSLERWHNLCLLGNPAGYYLSFDQVTELGRGTVLDNLRGSPFNGAVHYLLPKEGTPAASVVQIDEHYKIDFAQGVSYATRYELVDRIVAELEFNWMVTPAGDVAVEFPMFDFNPDAFGIYRRSFIVDQHATSASIEDEATDIPTAMVVTGQEQYTSLQQNADGMARSIHPLRSVVYSPVLATRLGANVEEIVAPIGLGRNNVKQLEAWAALQLQKRIGQSSTISAGIPFRPWLLPNRPLLHTTRDRMGLIYTINHSITINEVANTQPNMNYVRVKDNEGKYRYATGGENMAINYSTMFTKAGDVTKSGLRVQNSVYKGTSAGTFTENTKYVPPKSMNKPPHLDQDEIWLPEAVKIPAKYWGPKYQSPPDIVVIHRGWKTGDIANYFKDIKDGRKVSAHFVIENDGTLKQCAPLDHKAWHAGGGGGETGRYIKGHYGGSGNANARSIGIELRGPTKNQIPEPMYGALINLIARMKEFYPGLAHIVGHVHLAPSIRTDPGKYFMYQKLKSLGMTLPA